MTRGKEENSIALFLNGFLEKKKYIYKESKVKEIADKIQTDKMKMVYIDRSPAKIVRQQGKKKWAPISNNTIKYQVSTLIYFSFQS
jgi:uncharacterized membrane protein